MINYTNIMLMPQERQDNLDGCGFYPSKKEVNKMIDPSDISVPTIEYLFEMLILKLTAETVKGSSINPKLTTNFPKKNFEF